MNELWREIDCGVSEYSCLDLDGDPVVLTAGQQVESIDFTLAKPGVLTGRVLDTDSGEPLENVEVEIHRSGDSWRRYAATDELGRYRFVALEPGSYFLRTDARFHRDELFDDIDCSAGCDLTTGTPVVVQTDSVTRGIDFLLDRVPAIGGVVEEAATGDPIPFGHVYIYDQALQFVVSGYMDGEGAFWVGLPGPGTYFARTAFYSWEGYLNQMWQSVDCTDSCDLNLANLITVGDNELVDISFSVLRLGAVEGTVSATDGGGLGEFTTVVDLYDDTGHWVDDAYGISSTYRFDSLMAGAYFLTARNSAFRSEIYDDIACAAGNTCDPLSGSPVSVQHDATTSGIDFALDRLGIIEGRITHQATGEPIPGVSVAANSFPSLATEGHLGVETDGNGEFRIVGLEPGSYAVRTISGAWQDEAYDDLPCEDGCDLALADAVMASIGTVTSGINIRLERSGWIEGNVTDAATGDPIHSRLRLFNSAGNYLTSDYTDSDGKYLFEGREDGTYHLMTSSSEEYLDELFDNILCDFNYPDPTCDPTSGMPIIVSVENGAIVDFELDVGGVIEGTIRNIFGEEVEGRIDVFGSGGNFVRSVYKSISDPIYTIPGMADGNYYLVTSQTGHQDELWPNTPCLGTPIPTCNLADGIAVSVTLGNTTPGIDFVLDSLATIEGVLVDTDTGQTLSGSVGLYDASGSYVTQGYGNPFRFTEIPPGTYYLRTNSVSGYLGQVYGGETCDPSCDVTSGTSITVGIGDVVTGIEVPLIMGPGIRGRVIEGPTGIPVSGVAIDLWAFNGNHLESAITDALGEYRLPRYAGSYFVSTHNDAGFVDLVYNAIECPDGSAWEGLCDPTLGTPYVIESYQPLQRLDFAFGDPTVFTDGFESGSLGAWSVVVGGS